MPRTLLVLLLCVIASGCYHSVPTREPGREIWKLRYTSGVEIEFPRRHRAYWQDSVVVVEQHAGDEQPRIIPASDIEETWAREIQGGETKFLTGLIAGVLVLVLFVTGLGRRRRNPEHSMDEQIPPAPAPLPPRRYRIIEMSVALTAIIVSVAALVVAREQTQLMGKQLAASVWPVLDYSTSNTTEEGEPVVSLDLINGGIGPMRIRSFHLTYEDRPVSSAAELMEFCCSREYGPNSGLITSNVSGRVLGAGETLSILSLPFSEERRALFERLNQARFQVAVRTCYCSVLEDCWVLDAREQEPEPVESCDVERERPQYR